MKYLIMENNHLIDTLLKQGGTLPSEELDQRIFIPTWDNKPPDQDPVILWNGIPLLDQENICLLTAQPGVGKSSLCEAILSKVICEDADAFGLEVKSNKALYVDCEQSNLHTYKSWRRMISRTKDNADINKVVFIGIRLFENFEERKTVIADILQRHPDIDFILIDGAGDMVGDINDLQQAQAFKYWCRQLASKHKLAILTTLHPNPTDDKPRGHLGSEMRREAQSLIHIELQKGDIRKVSSDPLKYGKNRDGKKVEFYFKYGENEGRMISAFRDDFRDQDEGEYQKRKKVSLKSYFEAENELQKVVDAVLGNEVRTYSDLFTKTKQWIGDNWPECTNGDNAVKGLIKELLTRGMILRRIDTPHSKYCSAKPKLFE